MIGAVSLAEAVTSFATPRMRPHSFCEIHMKKRNPLGGREALPFNGTMDTQPPPNAPAPPPSVAALRSRRSYRIIWGVGIGSLLLFLVVAWIIPNVIRSQRGSAENISVNNAREIHKALFEFHVEYGSYPNPHTIPSVIARTGTTLPLGTKSSNDYFRQLIAMGADERMFYSASTKFRPSDRRVHGGEALKEGEGGFAYIVGLTEDDNPSLPLVIGPVVPGKKRFDPKPFGKRIVALRIDGSATCLRLREDGKIALGGGSVLDPAFPMWEGKPITIAWPE